MNKITKPEHVKSSKRSFFKKILIGTTFASAIFPQLFASIEASALQEINIVIDGKMHSYQNAPIIKNNRTYIPVREVTESLGAAVWWNGDSNSVGISKDNRDVVFVIGSDIARVNGVPIKMDPSLLSNGVTRVPLRFMSEALGMEVAWANQTRTVTIQSLMDSTSDRFITKNESNQINSENGPIVVEDNILSNDENNNSIKKDQTSVKEEEISSERLQLYTVKPGDTLSRISANSGMTIEELKSINHLKSDMINTGQLLRLSLDENDMFTTGITIQTYAIKVGDTIWDISIKYGVPMNEILQLNSLTAKSKLVIGQKILIPIRSIPVQETVSGRHGEYLDWWTEAQYLYSIGKVATVTDFHTGKSFQIKRTIGANHADCEPLTSADTAAAKQIWGGFNWNVRPVIVQIGGRKIAASMSFMPHDVEYIKDNNFNGHFDIHFKNSTRHKDGKIDPKHQDAVKIAAGH